MEWTLAKGRGDPDSSIPSSPPSPPLLTQVVEVGTAALFADYPFLKVGFRHTQTVSYTHLTLPTIYSV